MSARVLEVVGRPRCPGCRKTLKPGDLLENPRALRHKTCPRRPA